jgi:hypothetical protein
MKKNFLNIGGLVAAGLDPSEAFLLTVSHAGRGIFSTATWERVARDETLAYPEDGHAVGIGPLASISIPVVEIDYHTGILQFSSIDDRMTFKYESGTLSVTTNE